LTLRIKYPAEAFESNSGVWKKDIKRLHKSELSDVEKTVRRQVTHHNDRLGEIRPPFAF